jgi:hypothetical protein
MGIFAGLNLGWRWLRRNLSENSEILSEGYPLDLLIVLAALLYLIMMSHWWAWHGGAAYNQRMLKEIHPLLIFLLASYLGRSSLHRKRHYAVVMLALLWGIGQNVVRLTFYDQHLKWLETYHPEIVWSLKNMEVLMYVRWHGLWSVIVNSSITLARCLLVTGPAIVLLGRSLLNSQSKQEAKEVT